MRAAHMSPRAFRAWLDSMKTAKEIRSDSEAASLLGIHPNTIASLKDKGADQRTALACAALWHRQEPWADEMPKVLRR